MLVLTRKKGQSILIGNDIKVMVSSISKDSVRIGIAAPRGIPVFRDEIIKRETKRERKRKNV